MKKNYTIKTLVVLLAMVTMNMSAQLSGLYTIDKTSPASATNFTSFATFAAALNTSGVSGAVTADVVPNTGPYTEQVTFNSAAGVSATNSIVVNGNGNTLTFSSANSAQAWTLLFQGADYMTWNNLNIYGTGTYVYVTMFVGGADYNNFNNCTFNCPVNTTTSNHMNVVFSGSNSTYASLANSGSNNTFTGCDLKYGYYQFVHWGLTGSPYNTNNSLINCNLKDWYYMAVYAYYSKNFTMQGCVVDRATIPGVGFAYGLYLYYTQGTLIDKNRIRNFFGASPGNNNGTYVIYCYYNPLSGVGVQQNKIQNNIISDMKNNSYVYGTYAYYMNGNFDHNTIDLNNPTNNYTGTQYGFYGYGTATSYPLNFRNNCITMNMGGTGQKYCAYWPITSGLISDYNNLYNAGTVGTNYIAYYNGAWTTMPQLQAQGTNLNSWSLDPLYMSPNSTIANNYLPTNYTLDNKATPVGITLDNNSQTRGTVPDIGALEFYNTPCSGNPASSSVVVPTLIQCPGTGVPLSMATSYTTSGISIQWQSSTTSSVGPFTSISGFSNQVVTSPTMAANTWYSAIITCTNGNGTTNALAGLVQIAGTTTNTVPYFEDFEGISGLNKLPNCSWLCPTMGTTCATYTSAQSANRLPYSGTKFASFYYQPSGTSYYYTNGIYLNAGVTYSTGLMYATDYYGYANWTDLSIMLGTTQTTTGLVTLATSGGPAISPSYKLLSNTFTVGTSGLYYVAVKASTSGGSAQYLSFDDLFINVPCSLNSTSVSVTSNSTTICNGQPVTLTASGANSYTWSNGATGAAITVTPNSNTTYGVIGTNSTTTCKANASQAIFVNPTPNVGIFASKTAVCKGSSVNLNAFGAGVYNWSIGGSNPNISVSPTVATTYTVIGVNQFGCSGSATQQITVNNLPNVVPAATSNQMCVNETVTLSASGAVSYVWNSVSTTIGGAQVVVSPMVSTTYSVIGTDANGCSNSANISLNVSACTGLNEIVTANGVKVFPNPTKGEFSVEFTADADKTIEVLDVTGRVVMTSTASSRKVNFNLNNLANGVYYVKIQSNKTAEVVKVVKQ